MDLTEINEYIQKTYKVKTLINLRGTTVVVATHAKEIVDQMKKRVIHINKGVIVKDDKKGGYDCEI